MKSDYAHIPVRTPDLLLPKDGTDMQSWATVACDQYTSQPDYWNRVEAQTAGKPSTFHLMLPELYLEEPDVDDRIAVINRTMESYLTEGAFKVLPETMMLVRRKTKYAPLRTGLVMAFDLEAYDFKKGSGSLIRATEGTVTERIPPRMKIRKDAAIEMPHIMILIDDPSCTVIENLAAAVAASGLAPAYNFDLMEEGGHIEGYAVSDPALVDGVMSGLSALACKETFCKKYGVPSDTPVLLFAVGDGNHSLASAKCHYEENPNPKARYALAELINVHDAGIIFEPIHRVMFGVDADAFLAELKDYFGERVELGEGAGHVIPYIAGNRRGSFTIDKSVHTLAVGALQEFIDVYLSRHPEAKVDYIHGDDTVAELATDGNMGFILPAMDKNDLFKTVILNGALPRKTFSMGEACEKRFYLECREIR
ncbi:MAG: DUF1015 domain-containing protein [Clostridia bacterium]|nr:DUF1015 domain-containing protein [Clostridia bacterium]